MGGMGNFSRSRLGDFMPYQLFYSINAIRHCVCEGTSRAKRGRMRGSKSGKLSLREVWTARRDRPVREASATQPFNSASLVGSGPLSSVGQASRLSGDKQRFHCATAHSIQSVPAQLSPNALSRGKLMPVSSA